MLRVLFVCIHNSARSQMAEELLRLKSNGNVFVESAGLEPGKLNPFVIEALKTIGVDITGKQTKSVFDLFRSGTRFHYIITVCDESSSERCPIFPGALKYLHWSFTDPSSFTGSDEQKLEQTCSVMLQIEAKVNEFLDNINTGG